MATMKIGTGIGKTDTAYNQIKVGDILRNKHTGLLATVNKYGCPVTDGGIEFNPFNPDDWILDTPWDVALKNKHDESIKAKRQKKEAGKAAEESDPAPVEFAEMVPETGNDQSNIEETVKEQKEDVLFVEAPQGEALTHAKALEAVGLLRSLGYIVTATKTVTCTISL